MYFEKIVNQGGEGMVLNFEVDGYIVFRVVYYRELKFYVFSCVFCKYFKLKFN